MEQGFHFDQSLNVLTVRRSDSGVQVIVILVLGIHSLSPVFVFTFNPEDSFFLLLVVIIHAYRGKGLEIDQQS